jgi:hypothetical protein
MALLLVACAGASAAPPLPDVIITVADPAGFDSAPVAPEQLAALHAGADTVSNELHVNGAVTANSASYISSGANTISSGAFSNASGLPVAIQNSGSNVLIQNATIINIHMQ